MYVVQCLNLDIMRVKNKNVVYLILCHYCKILFALISSKENVETMQDVIFLPCLPFSSDSVIVLTK